MLPVMPAMARTTPSANPIQRWTVTHIDRRCLSDKRRRLETAAAFIQRHIPANNQKSALIDAVIVRGMPTLAAGLP